MPFKVGDAVVLASGGVRLTVTSVNTVDNSIVVYWVGIGPDATKQSMGPLPASCFLAAYSGS